MRPLNAGLKSQAMIELRFPRGLSGLMRNLLIDLVENEESRQREI